MRSWEGHFDRDLFAIFIESIGIYPVGTLVRLESGRLGVVVEQQAGQSLLLPKVRVFYSIKSSSYMPPELLDLADSRVSDRIVANEVASQWGLKDIDRFWMA